MQLTKRTLFKFFAAAAIPSMVWANPTSLPTPDHNEAKTINYLSAHGITDFTMLNKRRGQILFIKDSKIIAAESALTGKHKGDTIEDNLGTTPAGIFALRPFGNGTHIGFNETGKDRIDYTIHTIVNPPGQKRLDRILGTSAEFKRISSGCVNVLQPTMDRLTDFVWKSQQVFKDDQNRPLVMGSFFVVLPEKLPVESILKYPDFSTSPTRNY